MPVVQNTYFDAQFRTYWIRVSGMESGGTPGLATSSKEQHLSISRDCTFDQSSVYRYPWLHASVSNHDLPALALSQKARRSGASRSTTAHPCPTRFPVLRSMRMSILLSIYSLSTIPSHSQSLSPCIPSLCLPLHAAEDLRTVS